MQGRALLLQSELIGQCNYVEHLKGKILLPYLGHPEEGPPYLTAGKYSYVGPVTCYMSHFYLLFSFFFLDKIVKLVCEGLLSTGPTRLVCMKIYKHKKTIEVKT